MAEQGQVIGQLRAQDREIQQALGTLGRLQEYQHFAELDWTPLAKRVTDQQQALQALESASDLLQTLTQSLKALSESIAPLTDQLDSSKDERARTRQKWMTCRCCKRSS